MGAEISKLRGQGKTQHQEQLPFQATGEERKTVPSDTLEEVANSVSAEEKIASQNAEESSDTQVAPTEESKLLVSENTVPESTQVKEEATGPDDSLASFRERVQRLRAEGSYSEQDDQIRTELASSGLLDPVEATVSQSDTDSLSNSEIESSSDNSNDESGDEPVNEPDTVDDQKGSETPPKTKHEILDEEVPLPPVSQLDPTDLPLLHHIGQIHSIVDNVVLIAQTEEPTEDLSQRAFDVLDSGSLLSMKDGRVIGLVYETFGSVKAPFYSVRFPSEDSIDRDIINPGVPVYYLPTSSTYVLARTIRTKGSDASNIWDEEVGEDEAEYSDDEEEAAAKRRAKQERRMKGENATPSSPPSEVDPMEASLGPLGGYPAGGSSNTRGRKRKDKSRRGRGGFQGETKRGRPQFYGNYPAAPHINPRFAGQWMQAPPYGMPPVMPPFPPGFAMPNVDSYRPEGYEAYSPHHARIDSSRQSTYDPNAPSLSPRVESHTPDRYTPSS
ncbi:hypothetical protein CBS9595_002677 [Malassezia furfur]|nr:hypothetical protein CBS9595_002677 [Malassezia furfur]